MTIGLRNYRKRPVIIQAIQWDGKNFDEIKELDWPQSGRVQLDGTHLEITTLEGKIYASPDDWIIKGVKGELYPCKPDIFAETYEDV